jgi:urea transporter/murein DD-endopeptidase MepM/ murein hydrolase activator NlpD
MGPTGVAKQHIRGAILGYAYLFFSNSSWLGLLLMGVTFFDAVAGGSGLIAIAVCQLCSYLFKFNRSAVVDGTYSYNALMVGLALGSYYQWSLQYLAILIIASMLCLFLTVWIGGRLYKRGLPLLSIPFLLTVWVLVLGLFNFSGVKLLVKSEFTLQQWFPNLFSSVSNIIDASGISDLLHLYLRSISAILFQYNDLAGIIIATALLVRSRMAFALSIYGFLIGYGFYHFFEGDFTPLIYSYIGFNFILTAIALGGFFIVPSWRSHLLLVFTIPVTALLLSALHTVFSKLELPLYSLPFNIIVLMVIGALQMRIFSRGLELVIFQQFSPELNHYKHIYYLKRFAGQFYYHLQLPVMGEWHVPQGYNGSITHKDEWKYALDFDVINEEGKTFTGSGLGLRDYFCYDLPVLAPAAGHVTSIRDGVPDNAIADINLGENWGNTIIIKHADGFFTKLSHLKPGSLKVKEGDYVQRGEIVASCGSSGRSPEPHLHFQAQATPAIGSHTIQYPFAYFLEKRDDSYRFHSFEIPREGSIVRNVIPTAPLAKAFEFTPGDSIQWIIEEQGVSKELTWAVQADSGNRKYLYCNSTGAAAYFHNDGVLAYFTDFYGSRKSLLYCFYLAFQKVLTGQYKGVTVEDWLLPQAFFSPAIMMIQDFLAPVFHFAEGRYHFAFGECTRNGIGELIRIHTRSYGTLFGKTIKTLHTTMNIRQGGIEDITFDWGARKITAKCVH